jgi:nucleotide-binding universal stress UspA family protein
MSRNPRHQRKARRASSYFRDLFGISSGLSQRFPKKDARLPKRKERIMLSKILVPTDGSELSNKAVRGAVETAQKLHATLVGLTVTEPYPIATTGYGRAHIESREHYDERMRFEAEQHLAPLQSAAAAAGVTLDTVVRSSSSPYEAIIETAKDEGCDSIFMASHGRSGLRALLMGSETNKVLTHTDIPVLVFR